MNSILFVEKSIGLIVDFVHNVNPNSIFTLHRTRTRNRLGKGPGSIYYAEEFTLVRDRDQYSLFTVMPVLFPLLHAR